MASGEELFEKLQGLSGSKTVIVGIGNTLKGDDGLGPLICQRLRNAKISAEIIDAGTVPENYIQPIIKKAPRYLIIIDAIEFGAFPGSIGVFSPEQLNSSAFSTHTLSPRLFIDMIRREIDVDIYIIGIQPIHTQFGQSLSAEVNGAVKSLVDSLTRIFLPAR